MHPTHPLKRGATLSLAGTAKLPAPTGAWSGAAQVRSADGTLQEDLSVTVSTTPTPGTYAVLIEGSSVQTADWPEGESLRCDVRFADAAVPPQVVSSPTFTIRVLKAITDVNA